VFFGVFGDFGVGIIQEFVVLFGNLVICGVLVDLWYFLYFGYFLVFPGVCGF